jgi:hypothetical protein
MLENLETFNMFLAPQFHNRNLFLDTFPALSNRLDVVVVMALVGDAGNTKQSVLATQTDDVELLFGMHLTKGEIRP